MARGEFAKVDQFLAELDNASIPAELRSPIVELLLARKFWVRASLLFAQIAKPPPRLAASKNLLNNFAAMARHRPELAEKLAAAPEKSDWICDSMGRVGKYDSERIFVPLYADPDSRRRTDLETAIEALREFKPLFFFGIGDGASLADLASRELILPHGMQQIFLIVEPDLTLLRTIFSLYDFSSETGIIAQSRGRWYVGEDWVKEFRADLIDRADVALPDAAILHPTEVHHLEKLDKVRNDYLHTLVAAYSINRDWILKRSDDEWLDVFSTKPSRPPRVFFLTSRFTAVLKYSTQRCAETFESLGWQSKVVLETRDDERCTTLRVARELDEFRPDLVFVVNHLRREQGSLFHSKLPYICWGQDSMPGLQMKEAGDSIGPRDLVMSGLASLSRVHHYPEDHVLRCQCLGYERTVSPPVLAQAPSHDILYLSHASMSIDDLAYRVRTTAGRYHIDVDRAMGFFDEMVDKYRAGEAYSTSDEWATKMRATLELEEDDYEQRHAWAESLSFAHCTLHRQQGLRWALALAKERGLDAAVYGAGWEKHPDFAEFARGAVAPGEQADALVARAKINLCLEPWPVSAHWRGLDSMILGGFFLARAHDYHQSLQDLVDFLSMHGYRHELRRDGQWREKDVLQALPPALHVRWRELQYMVGKLGLLEDAMTLARREGITPGAKTAFPPRVEEVTFSTPDELGQRIDYFVGDEARRADRVAHFHGFVRQHLTYRVGIAHAIARMRELIAAGISAAGSDLTKPALKLAS
jgi:hypothetical protein